MKGDIRSVTVPGCVDGWVALHERFGRLPMQRVLEAAIHYASDGFPVSPLLAFMAPGVARLPGGSDFLEATGVGAIVRRPGVARALEAVANEGRCGFYEGEFGKGLLELGGGQYTAGDLAETNADWVETLQADVWGHRLWTIPPNSQGYLALAGAWIASGLPVPSDVGDPLWAHFLVESARFAAFDRVDMLSESADGAALLAGERLSACRDAINPDRAAELGGSFADGDTTYLCAVDPDGMAVSLIQSNASGFGADIAEPSTGIFLHSRGLGFSLEPGQPAEYGPRKRPPHTLSPLLVTNPDGTLKAVLGTMGGDGQPQVLLQLLDRLLRIGEPVGAAISAPRWILQVRHQPHGFDTWDERGAVQVNLEPGCPDGWPGGLAARGHSVSVAGANFGHAHAIVDRGGVLEGAADTRALTGEAAGF